MSNTFIKHYLSAFTRPKRAFSGIAGEHEKLKFAFISVSIQALLYTLVYVFLILGGGQPFKPWLNIPPETYYKYNVFFCAPSMYLGLILSAGVIHVAARTFTSKGSFEEIFCLFGFGIGIASWSTGVHDLLTSFLGAIHVIDQHAYEVSLNSATIWRTVLWVLMITYVAWFIILFSKAVETVYKLSFWGSVLLGLTGFLVYQFFFLIFNR